MARFILKLKLKIFFKANTTFLFCFTCLIIFTMYFFFLKLAEPSSAIQKPLGHTLCVLLPFRNVSEELEEFIPFMNEFLNRQSIKFHFVVVNHVEDGNRFNKGVVFNAGYEIISERYVDCDYIALHDIDLLPLNDDIPYTYPGEDVFHVAHPDLHPLGMNYDPERYVGGIALISKGQYLRTNGFSNNFWGWGGEDRNFFYRMRNNGIRRVRPESLVTNRNNTFKNIHSPNRMRDWGKCENQKQAHVHLVENDFESGLSDLNYELISVQSITIDQVSLTMFNISVPCDYSKTPWCRLNCLNNPIKNSNFQPTRNKSTTSIHNTLMFEKLRSLISFPQGKVLIS